MSVWRYRCMECDQEIVEESRGKQPKTYVAMCGSCAIAVTLEFLGGRPVAEPMCRDCETAGTPSRAHRMVGKTPTCDRHFRQRMGMPAAISTRRPTCLPCQQQGKHVPATLTVNGMNMCREHAGAAAVETREPDVLEEKLETGKKERKEMAHDKEQMQRDRDDGMSTAGIAKKHGVSKHMVYLYTRKGGGRSEKRFGRQTEAQSGPA